MADLKITADISDLTKLIGTVNQTKTSVEVLGRSFARSNDTSAYMRGINQIVEAQKRLSPNLRTSRSEIMRMGAAARQQAIYLQELNRVTSSVGLGVNRMGVLTQQAGYQIGDFIVQVQSGTNAFVAFGQQATQVAGTLTLLGGKWIAIGSALGVTIPLLTAIGAGFMRTRSQGRSLDTVVGDLETSLQRLSDVMTTETISGVRDVVEEFGYLDDAIESLIDRQEFLINMQLARSLQDTVDSLSGLSGGRWFDLGISEEASSLLNLQRQFDITRQDAEILRDSFLEVSRTDLGSREQADALQIVSQHLRTIINSRGQATQAELDTLDAVLRTEAAIRRQLGVEEGLVQIGQELTHTAELRAEILERNAQRLEDFYARRRQQAAESAAEELQALEDARAKTEVLERTFESLFNTSADSLVAEIARVAEQLGIATDEALKLALALPIGHSGITGGRGNVGMPGGTFNPARDLAIYDDPESSGGGGGGSGLNFVETLQREMELRTRLLGLGREEAELQTEIDRITTGLGESRNQYSDEFIANLARQNLALQEQEDLAERLMQTQEDFAQTVSESFGDALMSIIDGTKSTEDAFKAMAATIIRELYDILVVQQLVGSIRDSIGGSNLIGSFFSSMAGKASGGTMNANQPYLVGERGPEIVMPGRQSTVTNANLTRNATSQDSAPVVNMTYNFQGGITEADLARAMPMMVEKTKAAVVDTVQRGGSMARVFR